MLDTLEISPIIYIWYEGGWLSPPVVTGQGGPSEAESLILRERQPMAKKAAKKKAAKKR
jgi:hypothetical protein